MIDKRPRLHEKRVSVIIATDKCCSSILMDNHVKVFEIFNFDFLLFQFCFLVLMFQVTLDP